MFYFVLVAVALLIDFAYLMMILSAFIPVKRTYSRPLPRVSVIIPAKDGKTVEKTLKILGRIKKPKLEIIIVTNDSVTAAAARKYGKVVKDRGIGKGPALNAAVRKATSKMLYFLDEDSMVSSGTIEKVCSALNGYEVVAGSSQPGNKSGLVSRIARLYFAMLVKMQADFYKLTGTSFVAGRNFAIYKKTLKRMGGFRNELTEDLDLSFRLFVRGKKVAFVDALTREQSPSRLSWYLKQQQRWNAGAGKVIKEWKKRLHHHDIILFFSIGLVGLLAPVSLSFLLMGLVFHSYIIASVTLFGFLVALSGSVVLDKDELALFPLTFIAFLFVQTYAVLYSAFKKPTDWYRTPKH